MILEGEAERGPLLRVARIYLLNYVPRPLSGRDGQEAPFLFRSLAIICFLLQVFHCRQHFSYPWIGAPQ